MTPRLTVVMLAYGPEPYLDEAVTAALASTDVDVDLVLVDNGCTTDAVDLVKGTAGVSVVLRPDTNTGFAGGCLLGAAEATGDWLAFINSDAIVEPEALRRLVDVAAQPGVGMAMASIRLAHAPELMNTAGNPLHFTGLSWAGGCGQPADRYATRRAVAAGSGCCFVMSRQLWSQMDGFAAEYFAYCEDSELSLRLWQRGLSVQFVPDAVALHHYDFSRNARKSYLVERNRLIMVLTAYQARTLMLLAPLLALTELVILAVAVAQGWTRAKVDGWIWLLRHRSWMRDRRSLLQRERSVPDRDLAHLFTNRFAPTNMDTPRGLAGYNLVGAAYWTLIRRLL